jgi:ABC-type nitrate/sulfonate/bicarbonate transport system permease component
VARIKQPIGIRWKIFWGVLGILVLAGGYEWLSYRQHSRNPDDTTIPNLTQLWDGFVQVTTVRENPLKAAFEIEETDKGFWEKAKSTWLFQDVAATYGRLFKGLLWGCALSVFLGILMGCYEWFAALLVPVLSFLAKVPGTAMLAVFFVMVGTGESMFGVMIGFGLLPTLTQAVYLSAKHDVHEEEVNKAYTLGASNFEVIWNVVYRQTLPKVMENVRLQIGPVMVYLIAAEMLVGQVGMGYQIRMQQRLLNMAVVYDYLIILGTSGLLMDRGMLALRRRACPWFSRYR